MDFMQNKIEMIALRDTHYAGATVKKDSRYWVNPELVKILTATGAARIASEPKTVEPEPVVVPQEEPLIKKTSYKRRDMRAES